MFLQLLNLLRLAQMSQLRKVFHFLMFYCLFHPIAEYNQQYLLQVQLRHPLAQ
jgi:hypothetical protein